MVFFSKVRNTPSIGIAVAIHLFVPSIRFLAFIFTASIAATRGINAMAELPPLGSGGEVWEISTRHLPCSACNVASPIPFDVYRWSHCGWERRTIEEATGTWTEQALVPLTIIYVHGNFMERDNARERVRIINQYLAMSACEPYRILMLSWPSEHDGRVIQNVRDNAKCADSEAFYLASLLQMVNLSSERVSLLGFSLGARSVTGALHLDAGGSLPGSPVLPPRAVESMYRVSLVAPAVDRGWLQPAGRHRYAMDHVELLINLYNSRDPVLRRFRFIDSIARPIAAGFAGFESGGNPRSTQPLIASDRLRQYDCGFQIGNTHSELAYYRECPCFKKAIDNLLWKSP